MNINYLEKQLLNQTIFKDEDILELNYLPDKLLHRDQELMVLSRLFLRLIEKPFSSCRKLLIQGDIGIGKTLITRTFGKMLLLSAQKREISMKYVHINCRKEQSNYKILHQILTEIGCRVPKRGFSVQDLLTILCDYLQNEQMYLLLTLDELNHLQKTDFDLIYSLTRLNDSDSDSKQYLSLIAIVRNVSLLRNLDESTISTLQGDLLSLKKYRKDQIYDILNQRVELSLKPRVFSSDLLRQVSDHIFESGDIRKGLAIIRNSVKIAESKDHRKVLITDLYQAVEKIIPSLQNDGLNLLNLHQSLLLHSINSIVMATQKSWALTTEIKKKYELLCEKFHEKPRKNTQIWHNLQILKNYNLIAIKINSKNQRGRNSFCTIDNIPLQTLDEELSQKLKSYRFEGL